MIENKQKQVIHILLKEHNISDSTYRAMLWDNYRVTSCVNLTYEQAEELIHYIKYNYDENYKSGYNKGIQKGLELLGNCTQKDIISKLIAQKEHRFLTRYEEDMIDILDEEQKKDLIKQLISKS